MKVRELEAPEAEHIAASKDVVGDGVYTILRSLLCDFQTKHSTPPRNNRVPINPPASCD
jgi:hypothetical protein